MTKEGHGVSGRASLTQIHLVCGESRPGSKQRAPKDRSSSIVEVSLEKKWVNIGQNQTGGGEYLSVIELCMSMSSLETRMESISSDSSLL